MENNNKDRMTKAQYDQMKGQKPSKKAKKQKKPKEKIFTKGFVKFLLIVFVVVCLLTIFKSKYYTVSEVFVEGNDYLSKEEVLEKIDSPLGKNIFLYRTGKQVKKLEKDGNIKKASLEKVFPSQVNVSIEEVYPLFFYKNKDNTYYISNEGIILDPEDVKEDGDYIEVIGDFKNKKVGGFFTDDKTLNKFFKILATSPLKEKISQINLEKKSDIGIILDDINVEFGDMKNIDYKFKLLDSIYKDIKQKGVDASLIMLNEGKDSVVRFDEASSSEDDFEDPQEFEDN